ncbi:unnamed protein product [Rangifer tarandus platyrhynchus]|uniref:Uncharacterized protein n=1 Tax=Rangifer tarandus platyrhynchus TaxID=3082113 RepID=A0ACB1MJS0_RANTA
MLSDWLLRPDGAAGPLEPHRSCYPIGPCMSPILGHPRRNKRARRISPLRAKRESDSARRRRRGVSGHRAPPPISALAAGEIRLDKAASIADNKPLKCQEAQRPPLIAPRSPAPLSAALQRAFLSSFTQRWLWRD